MTIPNVPRLNLRRSYSDGDTVHPKKAQPYVRQLGHSVAQFLLERAPGMPLSQSSSWNAVRSRDSLWFLGAFASKSEPRAHLTSPSSGSKPAPLSQFFAHCPGGALHNPRSPRTACNEKRHPSTHVDAVPVCVLTPVAGEPEATHFSNKSLKSAVPVHETVCVMGIHDIAAALMEFASHEFVSEGQWSTALSKTANQLVAEVSVVADVPALTLRAFVPALAIIHAQILHLLNLAETASRCSMSSASRPLKRKFWLQFVGPLCCHTVCYILCPCQQARPLLIVHSLLLCRHHASLVPTRRCMLWMCQCSLSTSRPQVLASDVHAPTATQPLAKAALILFMIL